jgi:hypothetical protein
LNNPYFNGAYWEPKPWKSILFALALIAICLVVTPLLFELLVNTSFDFEWFDKAEEFVSQGARYV